MRVPHWYCCACWMIIKYNWLRPELICAWCWLKLLFPSSGREFVFLRFFQFVLFACFAFVFCALRAIATIPSPFGKQNQFSKLNNHCLSEIGWKVCGVCLCSFQTELLWFIIYLVRCVLSTHKINFIHETNCSDSYTWKGSEKQNRVSSNTNKTMKNTAIICFCPWSIAMH